MGEIFQTAGWPGSAAPWSGSVPEPAEVPDVTVIVPCYNVEHTLERCLSTVLANDRARLEVIVVNDGSKDGSLAVMRRFEEADPRVHVVDKPNGGYGMGVNAGLANAHGTYVAIVEPDDYVRPHFYDETVAFARGFPEFPDVVKTPYLRVAGSGAGRERVFHCPYYRRIRPGRQPFVLRDAPLLVQYHPSIWSALYRLDFLKEKGVAMVEAPGGGWVDNPFLVETLCQAGSIAYLDRAYYCYREDLPGSSTALREAGLAFERWNQMTDILERLGVDDPGILSAHYVRGFVYLSAEQDGGGGEACEEGMRRMFARMDPALVLASPYLGNGRKELFCRVRGIEGATWDRGAHLRCVAAGLWHDLWTDGPASVLRSLRG